MTSPFFAPTINPKLLPAPNAIENLDFESVLTDRMADFGVRATEAGFEYDVGGLETDPVKIDQEVHAYREILMRGRVNDAVRAVLPAYATGTDLDAIVARANIARIELSPAVGNIPAVMETDDALLLRYLTSYAAPAAGSVDGYTYHALMAYPGARDVAVLGPEFHGDPGRAAIYLLAPIGQTVSEGQVDDVRFALNANNVRPLTDYVTVNAAALLNYSVSMTVRVPRGPDPALIQNEVRAAVKRVTDARFAIGTPVYKNAIAGAAYIGNVEQVTLSSPAADVIPAANIAPFCTSTTITVEVMT